MRLFLYLIFFFQFTTDVYTREIGETEITTENGIEVYQNEKYYLLKKNVKINSDDFVLNGDNVKILFNKDLYDINYIEATGNVSLFSNTYNIEGMGEKLDFSIDEEIINIQGINSELITKDITMFSDKFIQVKNLSGKFLLKGPNSKIINDDIIIEAVFIEGIYQSIEGKNQIVFLNVYDETIAYIKNNNTEMYAKNIKFDEKTSIIQLEESVKIIRDGETITGDYGTLDTKNNSYKIKSNNSKKVRVVISNNDE